MGQGVLSIASGVDILSSGGCEVANGGYEVELGEQQLACLAGFEALVGSQGEVVEEGWSDGHTAGLEMVVCEEGGVLNEMGSPTPLCVFPSNSPPNSMDWVLKKVAELQECVGISCVGFEEQFNAFL